MFRRSGSFRLFDAFGIRVGVDLSWFLVLFLMIYVLSGPFRDTLHSSDGVAYVTTVVSVLALFASIIVHELGHAFAARRQGVGVTRIDLYMFGGLTEMTREPANPKEDFAVSVAGPLATAGVIVVCLAVAFTLVGGHRLVHAIELDSAIHITPVLLALSWLIPVNVLLLAFNLLPAFPLDGGKIARAAVWRLTGDKRRGTIASARLGQLLALAMAAFGVYLLLHTASFGGLYAFVLAWILYTSARGAIAQAAMDESVEGVRVLDIMDTQPVTIPADVPAGLALEEYFERYRSSWLAIVEDDDRFAGIVLARRARESVDAGEQWVAVGSLVEGAGAAEWEVAAESPITELFGSEGMRQLGAVMGVDAQGVLCGVVTIEQVRRAMAAAVPA